MLHNTGIALQADNWARSILGAIIMAAKVWDDHAVWTTDFCQIFPDVQVTDLYINLIRNDLERFYLQALDFNVAVEISTYVKLYFQLREMADTCSRPWALEPLRQNAAKQYNVRYLTSA
jgi:hypothetical protein